MHVQKADGETAELAIAKAILDPPLRHALAASSFAVTLLGKNVEMPGLVDFRDAVASRSNADQNTALTQTSELLLMQALILDSMFTELARRAASNLGQYLDASERYARLALKAQNNSRSTLEALAALHRPRESTVRHVHVSDGAQAIVADTFNHNSEANADADNRCNWQRRHAASRRHEAEHIASNRQLRAVSVVACMAGQTLARLTATRMRLRTGLTQVRSDRQIATSARGNR